MPQRKRKRPPKDRAATARAVTTGERIAAEVLRFRAESLRRRTRAVKRARTTGRARALAVPERLVRAAGGPERTGVLIAEGDSWFDYPWHDVLRMLEDEHGYDVESVAHKGDRIEDMAYNGGQLEEFARRIEKVLRQGVRPRAILLSGGGNDVAGDEFGMLLNHARSPRPGLNEQVVAGVLQDRVRNALVTIIAAVTRVCVDRAGGPIPIVLHGYDRAVPDGRGFLGGWGPLPGPWLEPGFRDKGFADLEPNTRVVADLINRFNEMLDDVAHTAGFAHVRYLDLRGTLPNDGSYKNWWANELHPTQRGFARVADKFAVALAAL
jgi:lysophospholipase L1-like esterase